MEVGKLVAKLGEITTRIENKAVWFQIVNVGWNTSTMSFYVNVKSKYNSLKNQCFGPLWLFNAVARVAKVYWANRIGPIDPNVSRCFESLIPWNTMQKHEEPQHAWNGLNPWNCQNAGKVTNEFKKSLKKKVLSSSKVILGTIIEQTILRRKQIS